MIASLLLAPAPVQIVRESAVVAAPPFAGFTTHVSADGTTALTAGYDGSLTFWQVAPDGKTSFLDALRLIGGSVNDGRVFALGPSGRQFAVSSWDGRVEVWDRASLKRIRTLETKPPAYGRIAFHPSRPWLLVGSFKGTQRLDLATGKALPLASGWPIDAVPNSNLLASPDGLTDGGTGRLVRRWRDRTPNVEPIRVSPDGKLVVIGGEDPGWSPPTEAATESAYARDQTLRTWRIADGKLLRTMPGFWTMNEADRDLVWKDARRLALFGKGEVRDAVTGRVVGKIPATKSLYERRLTEVPTVLRGAKGDRRVTLRFPDPGTRVSGVGFGPGKMVATHDLRTVFRNPGVTVGGGRAATVVTATGRTTRPSVMGFGNARGFDERGAYSRETWATSGPSGFAVVELISHPLAGSGLQIRLTLLTPGKAAQTQTFDIPKRQGLMRLIPEGYKTMMQSYTAIRGHGMWVLNSNYGDHNTIFAVSERDGGALWRLKENDWHPQVTSLAANRKWIAFSWERYEPRKTELVLVRADTGQIAHHIPCAQVVSAAFSPDGRRLGLITYDAVATVDLTAATPTVRPMQEGANPLDGNLSDPSLYWTPSGRLVATGSLRPIQVYDPASGRLLASARFFGDGSWSALRADGTTDGPAKTDVRTYRNETWKPSGRSEPFFLDLLK